jgi:predicted HNH restriction endonuclease
MLNELLALVATDKASEETAFLEGEKRAVKGTARNPKLREAAKRQWGLKCYCCGFDYEAFYGGVAKGLAIVHHLEPFQQANGKPRKATVKDVRVVCANCHHVIHVENPPIHVDDLKRQISESWTLWSEKGSSRKK